MPIYFSPLLPLSWSNKSTSEDNFIQFNRVAGGLLSLNSIRLKGTEIESIAIALYSGGIWWYLVVTSLSIALLRWRLTWWFNVGRGGKSNICKNFWNLLPIKFVEINYNITSYKFFLVFRLKLLFYLLHQQTMKLKNLWYLSPVSCLSLGSWDYLWCEPLNSYLLEIKESSCSEEKEDQTISQLSGVILWTMFWTICSNCVSSDLT